MTDTADATAIAVVLHDLAWLLPRTVGASAAAADPLPLSELEIMRLLARRPGLSVNDVAGQLGLQSTNVSTAVRALVGRGLLERQADDRDRRVVRLVPTELALSARVKREQSWGESLAPVLVDLPSADREYLLAAEPALRALADRLAGHEALSAGAH
jgi:DNA-binding MarR family transcriptional regulator